MNDRPLALDEFKNLLAPYEDKLAGKIAVAVSGGPDSMALAYLLSQSCEVVALTVDHGLRAESAAEAQRVGEWMATLGVTHHVLTRQDVEGGVSRVQEEARHDRYQMMFDFCRQHNIQTLCLAHHRDDQAETFLFRLAKGSGLDGLCSMQAVSQRGGVTLLRPLLDIDKGRLVATCKTLDVPYVSDPSNENEKFARVRLRRSMDVLSEEGLSVKRLAVTASRLSRARDALAYYADLAYEQHAYSNSSYRIEFELTLLGEPAEISLRCLLLAYKDLLAEDYGYGPRMEKLEDLHRRLIGEASFSGATLGGCIIRRDDAKNVIIVELEQKNATLD